MPGGAAELAGDDRASWAERIRTGWGKSLEAVLGTALELLAAKKALPHGAFEAMVEADLPFNPSTARKLMAIGRNGRLADRSKWNVLPCEWTTLYTLAQLDEAAFAAAEAAGAIFPDMDGHDAEKLRTAQRRGERLERVEALAALGTPSLAGLTRRYPVIYADPPWRYQTWSEEGHQRTNPANHYPTMSVAELAALPVGQVAADNAVLLLWATDLEGALEVMRAWGFALKSHCVWRKTTADGRVHRTTGHWFAFVHELLLLGTRGDMPAPLKGTQAESIIDGVKDSRRHSAKPIPFRTLIEGYFPGLARIELFARGEPVAGWDRWGLEAQPSSEGAAA